MYCNLFNLKYESNVWKMFSFQSDAVAYRARSLGLLIRGACVVWSTHVSMSNEKIDDNKRNQKWGFCLFCERKINFSGLSKFFRFMKKERRSSVVGRVWSCFQFHSKSASEVRSLSSSKHRPHPLDKSLLNDTTSLGCKKKTRRDWQYEFRFVQGKWLSERLLKSSTEILLRYAIERWTMIRNRTFSLSSWFGALSSPHT